VPGCCLLCRTGCVMVHLPTSTKCSSRVQYMLMSEDQTHSHALNANVSPAHPTKRMRYCSKPLARNLWSPSASFNTRSPPYMSSFMPLRQSTDSLHNGTDEELGGRQPSRQPGAPVTLKDPPGDSCCCCCPSHRLPHPRTLPRRPIKRAGSSCEMSVVFAAPSTMISAIASPVAAHKHSAVGNYLQET
jgi:hypothetical protein